MPKPSFRGTMLLGLACFVALYAIITYGLQRGSREVERRSLWVAHSAIVIDVMRRGRTDALRAESDQRGYILTGDAIYRRNFEAAAADATSLAAVLAKLVADNPEQKTRIQALAQDMPPLFAALRATMDLRDTQGVGAAVADLQAHHAAAIMQKMIANSDEFLAAENRLLSTRLADSQSSFARLRAGLAIASLVSFAILIALAYALYRIYLRLAASEAALARQTAVLRATLENIREGVIVFGEDNRVFAANNRFRELAGLDPDHALDGSLLEEILKLDGKRGDAILATLIGKLGDPQQLNTLHERTLSHGGTVECFQTALPDGGYVTSCLDVTVARKTEAALRSAQKMEAIREITGGLAHDFNNILQVIIANLDLVRRQVADNDSANRRLSIAMAGAERGGRLTQQLLAFARRQPLRPQSTDVASLVENIAGLINSTLGDGIPLAISASPTLWPAEIDRHQLEMAIINLAVNARDAMPGGGKLLIDMANVSLSGLYAASRADVAAGDYVLLSVADCGTGMPADIRARVFEPFFSTKQEGHGTGLGLSMVYGMVKQSGGHVEIYSEPGQGTTVKLYLPRASSHEAEAIAAIEPPAIGGRETILVVDDDSNVRDSVADLLSDLGYAVLQAEDAAAALDVLQNGFVPDLLFTDLEMPGALKGRELAVAARELLPDLKVLFTSGYLKSWIDENGRLDIGVALITKPYSRNEIARRIREVLDVRTR